MKKIKSMKINWYYLSAFVILVAFIGVTFYNGHKQSDVVYRYKENLTEEQIVEQKEISEQYNQSLLGYDTLEFEDVYSENDSSDGVSKINLFNTDEPIGSVEIPSINVEIPIYEGTSEKELQVGAGHLTGTSLPTGQPSTRSVITAHRGLTTKRMFRDLDKLEDGDIFFIDTYGEKKAYEIYNKDIVLPSDTSSVDLIEGEDIVTLLTCEPYMINTHRMLVDGRRVDYDGENIIDEYGNKEKAPEKGFWNWLKNLSFSLVDIEFIILIVFVLLFIGEKIYEKMNAPKKGSENVG